MDKIINLGGAVIFGSLGLIALIASLFYGATHQFVMAFICAIMTTVSILEYKVEKKKEQEPAPEERSTIE